MRCPKCGVSIPEAYDEESCPNCALPKKDRVVFEAAKPTKAKKATKKTEKTEKKTS